MTVRERIRRRLERELGEAESIDVRSGVLCDESDDDGGEKESR